MLIYMFICSVEYKGEQIEMPLNCFGEKYCCHNGGVNL